MAESPLRDYLSVPLPETTTHCDDMEIVSLDLETTGLDAARDRILSLGLVIIKGMSVRLDSAYHQVVKIEQGIPEASAVIHHITDDQSAAGQPIDQVLPELLKVLAGRAMLVHYGKIEQNFLDAACKRLYGGPFIAQTIDTLALAQRSFQLRNHSIQPGDLRLFNLRPRYNLPQYKAHNALSDALGTAELFLAMASEITPRQQDCRLAAFVSG